MADPATSSELPRSAVKFRADPEGLPALQARPETLARPWAIPGTPGLEHRIGGLEKQDVTGNVNYDPANHEHMVHLRADKVARIADDIPTSGRSATRRGELLVLGWGSTSGAIHRAVSSARRQGLSVPTPICAT